MADKWQEVSQTETHDFSGGPLIGVYTGNETKVGPNESNLYHFDRADGKSVAVWGSAVIDSRMSRVAIGTEAKIEYLGIKKNPKTGHEYKEYKVYTAA